MGERERTEKRSMNNEASEKGKIEKFLHSIISYLNSNEKSERCTHKKRQPLSNRQLNIRIWCVPVCVCTFSVARPKAFFTWSISHFSYGLPRLSNHFFPFLTGKNTHTQSSLVCSARYEWRKKRRIEDEKNSRTIDLEKIQFGCSAVESYIRFGGVSMKKIINKWTHTHTYSSSLLL